MNRFPIWIFPASIIVFFLSVIVWMLATNKVPNKKSTKKNAVYSQFYKEEIETPQKIKEPLYLPSIKETNQASSKKYKDPAEHYYAKAILYFEKADYNNASLNFLQFLKNSENGNPEKTLKSEIYLAYSLLFLGMKENDENILEKSQKRFLYVYKSISSKDSLYPRVVLGLAKTSRLVKNYPEGMDILLKQSSIVSDNQTKKHIYLELGFYYFNENKLDSALFYFEKSSLPIANQKFFDVLIKKEDTSLYLLTLFSKGMIPKDLSQELKNRIHRKVLEEARRTFQEGRKEEGIVLLKKMIVDFSNEPVTEESYFYLGDFYAQMAQFEKALYYFDQVLSNAYLDFDAPSLLKKGVIYYKLGNYDEALKNFHLVRENFVSTKYYKPAMDWIKEVERTKIRIQNENLNRYSSEVEERYSFPEKKNQSLKKESQKSQDQFESKVKAEPKESKIKPEAELKDSREREEDWFLKDELPDEELY